MCRRPRSLKFSGKKNEATRSMNARLIASLAPAAAIAGPAVVVAGLGVLAGILILDFFDDSPKPATAGGPAPLPQPTPDMPKARAPRPVVPQVPAPTPQRQPAPRPVATPAPSLPAPAPRIAAPVPAASSPVSSSSPAKPTGRKAVKRLEAASVRAALEAGPCSRGEAVARIRSRTGCGQTAAYNALAPGGPFSDFIHEDEDGRLSWRAPVPAVA